MTEYLTGISHSNNISTVYCWNYTTGNIEHTYCSKCTLLQNGLCVLSNDYIIVAEEGKPLLHVWPINSQEPKMRLVLPGNPGTVCVDNSGTYLLVGIGVSVYIWMISSGELLNVLEKNYQPVSCIKTSNRTEHVIVAGKDGFLIAYNFNEAVSKSSMGQSKPLYIKMDHTDAITDVAVGNFGCKSRVASVSLDNTCRVYDLHNGDPLKVLVFVYGLSAVLFDATCWNIYVGDIRGSISIIQIENGQLTQHLEPDTDCFKGHLDQIISMDINRGNNLLATASKDSTIVIWDLKTRKQLRTIKQEVPAGCVRFLSAHDNIHSKSFKPRLVLKPLKKNKIDDIANLETSVLQSENIEFSDSVQSANTTSVSDNSSEIQDLKIVNNQLYNLLMNVIKKNYENDSE